MASAQLAAWLWVLLYAVGALLVGVWTYLDADGRRSDRAWLWASVCALFLPFVPVYLMLRHRIGYRIRRSSARERLLGAVTVAHFWAFVSTLAAPSSPGTLLLVYVFFLPFGALLGYWLVLKDGWGTIQRQLG